LILNHDFSKDFERLLYTTGIHYHDVLHRSETLDVDASLETIKSDIYRVIPKKISVGKQYKVIEHLLDSAEKSKGVYCISSFPSDERAKHVAVSIVANILQRSIKSKKPQAKPLWHRVYGGFKDDLRDKHVDKPSLIVLSNIDATNSSGAKLEKIRDILEKFDSTPRLVVLAGGDPNSFFGNMLHYPLRAGAMLGPPNRIKDIN
jgi:hypothetical protein